MFYLKLQARKPYLLSTPHISVFKLKSFNPYLQPSQGKFNELSDDHNQKLSETSKHHRYKLAANTMSLLITLIPSLNLFSKSVLPMFFAA
jgi:hypothetical protein